MCTRPPSERPYQGARVRVEEERGVSEPGVGPGICGQWHVVAVPAVMRPGVALALLAGQRGRLAHRHSPWHPAHWGHRLHCRRSTAGVTVSNRALFLPQPTMNLLQKRVSQPGSRRCVAGRPAPLRPALPVVAPVGDPPAFPVPQPPLAGGQKRQKLPFSPHLQPNAGSLSFPCPTLPRQAPHPRGRDRRSKARREAGLLPTGRRVSRGQGPPPHVHPHLAQLTR